MILSEGKYNAEEYEGLVKMFLESTEVDAELQHPHLDSILNDNPVLFLRLFQAVEKMRQEAKQSHGEVLVTDLNSLDEKLYNFEKKLHEHTNIIPANLAAHVLEDRNLIERYLTENWSVQTTGKWREFQNYITDKFTSLPREKQLTFLNWCIDMLEKNWSRHKRRCANPGTCVFDKDFPQKIDFVKMLIEENELEQPEQPVSPAIQMPQTSGLKLADRKGAKIDLIRIVNAMYELGFFRDQEGMIPPKKVVMTAVGAFFDIDLSDYDKDLSQALRNGSIENNIKVFKDLEEVTKNKVI